MLIDTSGWLNLLHKREREHLRSIALFDAALIRITTNNILAELIPLSNSRKIPRKQTHEFIRNIETDESIEVIWIDEKTHEKAMRLLGARLDKTYSLCDAVSFIVMREHEMTDALTTDRHFKQEGFVRLLE